MISRFLAITVFITGSHVFALQQLPDTYLVSYGNPQAPIKITEFYSFNCPHCVSLFQREFHELKTRYLDTNQVLLTFHPIPMDLVTLRAMHCLGQLAEDEKRVFLEVILDVIDIESPKITTALMAKAMEVLKKPISDLENDKLMECTRAFNDAFLFLKQQDHIAAVPTVDINGTLFPNDLPTLSFFEQELGNQQEAAQ